MFNPIGLRICQLLMLLQIFSYTDAVRTIALGAFDTIGLPGPMIRMEAVANGFSALGWTVALAISFTSLAALTPRIIYVLAGMMWFDVLTTWPLDMPLPDGFLYWGTVVAAVQAVIAYTVERHLGSIAPSALAVSRRLLLAIPIFIFGYSAASVARGDFVSTALPEVVHQAHLIANSIEAVGWVLVFLMCGTRHASWAGRIALVLIGMWLWDMLTTLPLDLPVPPGQQIWGPVSIVFLFFAVAPLLRVNILKTPAKD